MDMPNALTRRLEEYVVLSDKDRAEFARISALPSRIIQPRYDLIRQGDAPSSIFLVLDGWACHYRTLEDGRRQIVDFAIPGDLCDLNIFILDRMDHSIGALTRLRVAEIRHDDLYELVSGSAAIATALWWQELVSRSINREWIVNVGQRRALERIAHLFCEMFLRLETVGLTHGFSCDFPLTQNDLADATGLTSVHVNRTVQQLRQMGLVVFQDRKLTIPDLAALQKVGSFNPDYLHHRHGVRHSEARRRIDAGQAPDDGLAVAV
jgi:CRP-like cAMP-binding protein